MLMATGLLLFYAALLMATGSSHPLLNGTRIGDAFRQLKLQHSQVCMTSKQTMGGLSNTMGLVNTAMSIALANNVTWVMPAIMPPKHHINEKFATMFGETESCDVRVVPAWKAICPQAQRAKQLTRLVDGRLYHMVRKQPMCFDDDFVLVGHVRTRTNVCGCDVLVEQMASPWHFDYSRTGPYLSELYWRHRADQDPHAKDPNAPMFPMVTVMHIRLGDVEGKSVFHKFVDGRTLALMVAAFASVFDINGTCFDVTLVTDGERNNKHVLAVQAAWQQTGAPPVRVSDSADPVDTAFGYMTNASILFGGPSGFPRLAAVLGRALVKVFLTLTEHSHPISYLPGATELPSNAVSNWSEMLLQNDALRQVASSCKEWLSR